MDPIEKKGTYNVMGYVMGNGLTSFMYDGYFRNAIENLAQFYHLPLQTLLDYQRKNCSIYDDILKDRKETDDPECLLYVATIKRMQGRVQF